MNKKRFVGFAAALAGILLSLSSTVLTGAVIGETNSSVISIIGAFLVLAGLALLALAQAEEKKA